MHQAPLPVFLATVPAPHADRGLPRASRHTRRSLHDARASLSGPLSHALTDGRGAFDSTFDGALDRARLSLCQRRQYCGNSYECREEKCVSS
jgi:hypothetical protein